MLEPARSDSNLGTQSERPPAFAAAHAAARARDLLFVSVRQNSRLLAAMLLGMTMVMMVAEFSTPVQAQEDYASRRAAAEGQFERAEASRATLEAKTERERSLREYEAVVMAYRRVYLITPSAAQVPPAIKQVADLYRRMGEQFESKYSDEAIKTYEFLIHDYPESSLREAALLAIAEIRKDKLSQPELAQKNYEDFLQQYPRSSFAAQARKALAQIKSEKIQSDKIQSARNAATVTQQAAAPSAPMAPATGIAAGGSAALATAAGAEAPNGASPGGN